MYLSYWCVLLGSLAVLHQSASLGSSRGISKLNANEPKKPVFPDTFQAKLEGIFKDRGSPSELDGSIYFDKRNNRASVDFLWQNERRKMIYKFETNELITIEGLKCSVSEIPNDTNASFFPFTVDKVTKGKKIAPAEKALYFYNSTYYAEDLLFEIPLYEYMGTVDIPQYNLKGCSVIHTFTKPEFEIATCEDRYCQPTINSITARCGDETDPELVYHTYKFFHFRNSISDESVFQEHPGIFCSRNKTIKLPMLPSYFSFSYDFISQETQVESVGSVRSLHKELWYDSNLRLIRVDDYNNKKSLLYTKVYDFLNEVSYVIPAKLEADEFGDIGTVTMDMHLGKATLLPVEIFPYKFRKSNSSPVYIGKRMVHDLHYDVWSVMAQTPEASLRVVTDTYFLEIGEDESGSVISKSHLDLSHFEFFAYDTNAENVYELSETRFIPVSDFDTVRDWSAFDVSLCFNSSQKTQLQLKIEGPQFGIGSKIHDDIVEQVYLKTVTLTGISVIRISDLKIVSMDENGIVFKGWILENPLKFGFGKNNTEPDMKTAYSQLEKGIKEGFFSFNVTDENEKAFQYNVSILDPSQGKQDDDQNLSKSGYTGGAMAGIAIVMLIVGVVIGVAGLVTFLRSKKGVEVSKLVNSS